LVIYECHDNIFAFKYICRIKSPPSKTFQFGEEKLDEERFCSPLFFFPLSVLKIEQKKNLKYHISFFPYLHPLRQNPKEMIRTITIMILEPNVFLHNNMDVCNHSKGLEQLAVKSLA